MHSAAQRRTRTRSLHIIVMYNYVLYIYNLGQQTNKKALSAIQQADLKERLEKKGGEKGGRGGARVILCNVHILLYYTRHKSIKGREKEKCVECVRCGRIVE